MSAQPGATEAEVEEEQVMRPLARFGLAFNRQFERFMFVIIPCSMIVGYLGAEWLGTLTSWIVWLFAWITFVMALGCGVDELRASLQRPWLLLTVLGTAHVVAPMVVYGIGVSLFGADSPYVIGLVLFAAIPLGVSSIIWVGLSRGHVALTLALVVISTVLSPLIVPAIMAFFFGTSLELDYGVLFRDLTLMIVAPTVCGVLVNHWTRGSLHRQTRPYTAPTTKIAFVLVVMINVAAITPFMNTLSADLPVLIPITIFAVLLCYALGFLVCLLPGARDMLTTVPYLAGMRNISLGIVIGLHFFGPLTAVPVVLAILIQQPLATVNHWLLRWLARSPGN